MTPKDNVLIDMAESSIKALGVTVCIVSLRHPDSADFAIQAASPIKRDQPIVLDIGQNIHYEAYRKEQDDKTSTQPVVIRDVEMLGLVDRILELAHPLQSVLQVPMQANGELLGYLVFGEVRNWERAPFTGEMIEIAKHKARRIEGYLGRKTSYYE